MLLLVLSIVALLAAPLLIAVLRGTPRAFAALDGFVVVGLPGMVLLLIMPGVVETAGAIALVAFALGLVLPWWIERRMTPHDHWEGVTVVALLGLCGHAVVDGAALASGEHGTGELLAIGVVFHQLPVGAAVWTRLRARLATLVLLAISVATALGFAVGETVFALVGEHSVALFEAVVCGALLHVAVEPMQQEAEADGWPAGVGALGAALALVGLAQGHADGGESARPGALESFVHLTLASAPALLGGVALMTAAHVGWTRVRALVPGGVAAIAHALQAIGGWTLVPAATLALALLGGPLTALRVLGWGLVAGLNALLASRERSTVGAASARAAKPDPADHKFLGAASAALFERTMPWTWVGLGIAAFAARAIPPGALGSWPSGVQVALLALLGVPTWVSPVGATAIAAVLGAHGASTGSVLAFLWAGPMSAALLGRAERGAWGTARRAGSLLLAGLLSVALGALADLAGLSSVTRSAPTTRALVPVVAALLLLGLTVLSLLRRGPRPLIGELAPPSAPAAALALHEPDEAR